jgi:predicted Fe-Mo cluster-binding NifX family protein
MEENSDKIKISIASEGKNLEDKVSLRAGRAPYYLIFDGKKMVKAIRNPFAIGGGGAGFSVAKMLSDEKVDLVIAGKFGPNMESALKQKKIKLREVQGISIKEALDRVS